LINVLGDAFPVGSVSRNVEGTVDTHTQVARQLIIVCPVRLQILSHKNTFLNHTCARKNLLKYHLIGVKFFLDERDSF